MSEFLEIIEPAAVAVANKATMAGSAGSILAWANSSSFGMWVGIGIGLAGLFLNWFYKRKDENRLQAAHLAYMRRMRQEYWEPLTPLDRDLP